ncbi:IS3 family transposase, partial [Pantoea allii]|nr:IS3 family transposase [Pantoea allii]MBW1260868.1 IS3 family transposase [Pantoea allii]MBW1284910.1 IS3 family transposase [Pantoea allii]
MRRSEKAHRITEEVRLIRLQQPRLGTRKLQHILNEREDAALHIGRDSLFAVLREARLLVHPARAYHKTTNSRHHFYRHPNLLKAGPEQTVISGPEQVWVADITWLPVRTGMAYISL